MRKEFPVLASFQTERPIGVLQIEETALPELPDWHLALGFKAKAVPIGPNEYQLVCLAVMPDHKFTATNCADPCEPAPETTADMIGYLRTRGYDYGHDAAEQVLLGWKLRGGGR